MGWILLGVLGASLGACALLSSGGGSTPPPLPPSPQFSVTADNSNALYSDIGGKDTNVSQEVYTVQIIPPKTFRIKASDNTSAIKRTVMIDVNPPFYTVKNNDKSDCANGIDGFGQCKFTVQYRPDTAQDYDKLTDVTVKVDGTSNATEGVKVKAFGVPTSILNPSAPIHIDTKTSNIWYDVFITGDEAPPLTGHHYVVNHTKLPITVDLKGTEIYNNGYNVFNEKEPSKSCPNPNGTDCEFTYTYFPNCLWYTKGVGTTHTMVPLSFSYQGNTVRYNIPVLLESYGTDFLVDPIGTMGWANPYTAGKNINFVKDIGSTWYVGSDNGLLMSLDAGTTWQAIPGLPSNNVIDIVVSDYKTTSDDPYAVIAMPHSIAITELDADQLNAADPQSRVNIVMPTQNEQIYNSATDNFPKGTIQTIKLCQNPNSKESYALIGTSSGVTIAKLENNSLVSFTPLKFTGVPSPVGVNAMACPAGGDYVEFGTDSGLWQAQWQTDGKEEPMSDLTPVQGEAVAPISGVYATSSVISTANGDKMLFGTDNGLYSGCYSLTEGVKELDPVTIKRDDERSIDPGVVNDITLHASHDGENVYALVSTEKHGLLIGIYNGTEATITSAYQYAETQGEKLLPSNNVNSASISSGIVMIATDAGLAKGDWLPRNGTIAGVDSFSASDLNIDVRTLKVPQSDSSDEYTHILIGGKDGLYDIRIDRQTQKTLDIYPFKAISPSNDIQSIDFCDGVDAGGSKKVLIIGTANGFVTITKWDTENPDVSTPYLDLESIVKVLFFTNNDAYILTKNAIYTSQWQRTDSTFSNLKGVKDSALSSEGSLEYTSIAATGSSSSSDDNNYNLVMGLYDRNSSIGIKYHA